MQHHSTFKTGFLVSYYCSKFYTFKVKLWKSTLPVCAVLLESVKFMLNTFGVSLLGFTLYYFIILYFCKWIFWILRYRKLFRYRFRSRHHWINLLEVEVPQLQTNISKLQQFFIKFERLVALRCKHKKKDIAWETCCGQWWISSMKNFWNLLIILHFPISVTELLAVKLQKFLSKVDFNLYLIWKCIIS